LPTNLELGTYALKVLVGYRKDASFPGYTIELLAGGNLLISNNSPNPPKDGFEERTVIYATNLGDPFLGQSLGIKLISNGTQTDFDLVTLDFTPSNVTPIPSNLCLLGTGLIGLLGWRIYKKN
jgi:hypothetical protein